MILNCSVIQRKNNCVQYSTIPSRKTTAFQRSLSSIDSNKYIKLYLLCGFDYCYYLFKQHKC